MGDKEERLNALQQICAQFGVATLYVFGSRAKRISRWFTGELLHLESSPSDVDVGVKAMGEVTWSVTDKVRLAVALEALLQCLRVDLVVLDEADPFLAAEVIHGERLFARDQSVADEYDLYVLRRVGDLAPLEKARMALVLGEAG